MAEQLSYYATNAVGHYYSGEGSCAILPKYYKADGTRRCIITAHGLLGGAFGEQFGWHNGMQELRTFAALGFPCIHTDLGGPATWGNDTVQARITDAWNYMKFVWNVADDHFVGYAQSMGGPALLNYMRNNPDDMCALAGEVPVIGLAETHDRDPLGLSGSIEDAYGGLSGYNAAIATHDPFPNRATHAALGIPTKFWIAIDDSICSYGIALQWVASGAGEGVTITGGHQPLPPEFFDDVGDFLRPYVFRQPPVAGTPLLKPRNRSAELVAT